MTVNCDINGNCDPGFYCEKPEGDCDGEGVCTPKPGVCPLIYIPVCGCDGQTYGNDCEAAMAGVSIAYQGECGEECNSNSDCNPEHYCKRPMGDCDGKGVCITRPLDCPWLPIVGASVCGCDGQTYPSECDAAQLGVSVRHRSFCRISEICSTLGSDSPFSSSDIDIFEFTAEKGEEVIIRLGPDPYRYSEGKYATLILKGLDGYVMWLSHYGAWRGGPTDKAPLPIERSVTLPATGEYEIWVVQQGAWGAWPSERFVGDYCLILESSGFAWARLQPGRSVE